MYAPVWTMRSVKNVEAGLRYGAMRMMGSASTVGPSMLKKKSYRLALNTVNTLSDVKALSCPKNADFVSILLELNLII